MYRIWPVEKQPIEKQLIDVQQAIIYIKSLLALCPHQCLWRKNYQSQWVICSHPQVIGYNETAFGVSWKLLIIGNDVSNDSIVGH